MPPLPLPDLQHLPPLDELARYPAVALFVERARAANPGFALTTENAAAVAAICARLDGLPLAIELAAARIRLFAPPPCWPGSAAAWPPPARPDPDAPARQQTLRGDPRLELPPAVAAWSSGCLSGWRSSPAAGPWTRSRQPWTNRRRSTGCWPWWTRAWRAPCPAPGAEPRFRLLLTLRQYALELLAAQPEQAAWRDGHARYYLSLAERAHTGLTGPQQGGYLQQLDAEHDNLRAALGWAIESQSVELALRLSGALARFWDMRGHAAEGQRWLGQALALPGQPQTATRANALLAAWAPGRAPG